jgi:WD40 repeat protein
LDGSIKLWDINESRPITELKDPQKTSKGIRGMTYSYEYGGNLLSFGFENYINVWCPEISLTRSYIGKLEGHNNIIVACKFIKNSPNCVSIDDKSNIRIWDIRILSPIQVISAES